MKLDGNLKRDSTEVMRSRQSRFSIVLIIFMTVSLPSIVNAAETYNSDCSANSRLRCRVEEASCTNHSQSLDHPSAPFDLRVSPYVVAPPKAHPDAYQLWVNISWKPTYQKDINKTKGFHLTIIDKESNEQRCFSFDLEQPQWEQKDRHTTVRFEFSTVDLFHYGHRYYIEVHSLPKPISGTSSEDNYITQEIIMPIHPARFWLEQLNRTGYFESLTPEGEAAAAVCGRSASSTGTPASTKSPIQAHPQASKWIAAFRYVYIQPKAKYIYVDFVAAPPQYCFEEYELRLLKDMHYIVDHTKITRKDLYYEHHGNVSVTFGNYTFHNVTPDVYEIGIIPVDRSNIDSRCLCPSLGQICACSQAVWPDVVMPEPPKVIGPPADPCAQLPPSKRPSDCPVNGTNHIAAEPPYQFHSNNLSSSIVAMTCLLVGALLAIVVAAIVLKLVYRRYKTGAIPRLYILPMHSRNDFDDPKTDGTIVSQEMTPILHPMKVLIIYSRDCPFHEAAIHSLADYLQNQCICDVRTDYMCTTDIDTNKYDWAYKSIVEADRVLIVNSYGGYLRYQAKLLTHSGNENGEKKKNGHVTHSSCVIERSDSSPYDDLFVLQLDMITQYQRRESNNSKFLTLRFSYTPAHFLLPHASPYLQFEIPNHLKELTLYLHGLNYSLLDSDLEDTIPPRLRPVIDGDLVACPEGEQLQRSIDRMKRYTEECPNWFEILHVRRSSQPELSTRLKETSDEPSRMNVLPSSRAEARDESLYTLPVTSWPVPAASSHSAADSGFDETDRDQLDTISTGCPAVDTVASTAGASNCNVVYSGDTGLTTDQNQPLLEKANEYQNQPLLEKENAVNLDSGIGTDLVTASTASTSGIIKGTALRNSSPKQGLRNPQQNGSVIWPSKVELDSVAIERLRLIC